MNKHYYNFTGPVFLVCIVMLLTSSIYNAIIMKNWVYSAVEFLLILLFALLFIWLDKINRYRLATRLKRIVSKLSEGLNDTIMNFPMALSIVNPDGEILWYNDKFLDVANGRFPEGYLTAIGDETLFGQNINLFMNGLQLNEIIDNKYGVPIKLGEKSFSVYCYRSKVEAVDEGSNILMTYWVDNTELNDLKRSQRLKKPLVGILSIDNFDDMVQTVKDDERAQVVAAVEEKILTWANEFDILVKKIERDRFYLFMEEQNLEQCTEDKFSVLERVKEVVLHNKMPMTISIGIGRDADNLFESDEFARNSIDLALGRGGDQVVIRSKVGYEFFGGKSQGIERRNKVKARVMASALSELIENASTIFVMGHRYADLDSFGSSLGIIRIAACKGKIAHIVMDSSGSMDDDYIYEFVQANEHLIVSSETAYHSMNKESLLIILDAQRSIYVEASSLLEKTENIVVIDHHKKGTDYISNATLFYHEPYSSSCCELVAELLPYFESGGRVTKLEAKALLAGIVLDTKNFAFKTGVRTFEAASYLKKTGADMIDIKRIFQCNYNDYITRTKIMSTATFIRPDVVLATSNVQHNPSDKALLSQVADELLDISGVEMSFVIAPIGDDVHISARSLGLHNVQLIMEKLGGGGHHAIAGSQLINCSLEEGIATLNIAIEKYFTEE